MGFILHINFYFYIKTLFFKLQYIIFVLKIKQIDIIYEDSASTNLLILKSISADDLSIVGNTDTSYIYKWEGDKPFKTLPEKDLTRVYDKIPVRSLSQEIAGNRVIYGNYQNKHTPPKALNYNVAVSNKSSLSTKGILLYILIAPLMKV